jgi:hypothetical protein
MMRESDKEIQTSYPRRALQLQQVFVYFGYIETQNRKD